MKKYFQAPWSLRDLYLIVLIIILFLLVAVLGLSFFDIHSLIENSENGGLYFTGIVILQWLVVLIPLMLYTKRKYKLKWKHFGFKKIKPIKAAWLVISSYLFYLGLTFIILMFIIQSNVQIPGYQIQDSVLPNFGTDLQGLIIAGITTVLIAPIIEEIFFRGFLLRTITNRVGIVYGSILTALSFAMIHIPWQSIIPIFILGLIINSLVIRSKSIWPAIGFHIFHNAISFTIQVLILKEVISLESLV